MSLPPVLTETARPSERSRKNQSKSESENQGDAAAARAVGILEQHVLLDGFKIVFDDAKSRGSYLYNAASDSRLIDFYGFFGLLPFGYNDSDFAEPAVQKELASASSIKVANSDVYSTRFPESTLTF